MSFEQFREDDKTTFAVIRALEIVGTTPRKPDRCFAARGSGVIFSNSGWSKAASGSVPQRQVTPLLQIRPIKEMIK